MAGESTASGAWNERQTWFSCEGCRKRTATCWTADDIHLCKACYDEIPPSPDSEGDNG